MAEHRRFELDELLVRPGTYFNPQTEVLVVVDDSPEMDQAVFNMEDVEGADWVLVSDESPIDEAERDEMLERFQVTYHSGAANSITDDGDDVVDELEEDDSQEVGRED
ncbi:hypothetical protein [Conexibacter woesei]|uniref:Uncharacterized protein n=1 Tax=Conexibacter woesei (strain DSM 14684 / CCUG 47730 / CIP 108061 / JCM 11494 / NBRC 100937 / ID131577) TaxID=469383 RepID=D3F107_CONWI|nr:hypothetical protein [Conexibacter woesei]ADB50083.1 hypothetical protein Cwoe_1656 [Conexibacter woesei DSM 14684]